MCENAKFWPVLEKHHVGNIQYCAIGQVQGMLKDAVCSAYLLFSCFFYLVNKAMPFLQTSLYPGTLIPRILATIPSNYKKGQVLPPFFQL